ncbi:MAG: glutathione S-transferase [Gammaproteobacteria bacterium]|nr:glutathione S-transferase [Gammaproteobacteria bacterium]
MQLYDLELSGNCYKIRLFSALLSIPMEKVTVDLRKGEHRQADFLALNPLGQIPVLVDSEVVLRDSQAILVYLARLYGGEDWLPSEAGAMARVVQWLATAANEIAHGPAAARAHDLFGAALDVEQARAGARRIIGIMDRHLRDREWLELGRPTIADIACFPYVALAHEGHVFLTDYPNVVAWIARIKALPGFVNMPGL